ncbi:MAG: LAGLIDADG endonuclease [Minisyncoccales bacterium]
MGNTVGSLTHFQKSVIIGCILGDGYLRKLPGRKNAFLEVNHSIKAKEYVFWKYSLLKNICLSKPTIRKIDLTRVAIRFFTRQHPEITKLYEKFYQDGKKVIPVGFKLDPISLAVWYMDDGSKTKKGDVYLNSQQFEMKSQRRLLHALRMIKIRARLNKDKKYYRIRIYKESIPQFLRMIKPYLHPSFSYKISGLNPVETHQEKIGGAS